jgi:hypothetical protein
MNKPLVLCIAATLLASACSQKSARLLLNRRGNTLDPHFLLNVQVNQKIGDTCTLFGEIRNLLNTSYESFRDYPMPGLTVTLGIRMQFDGLGQTGDPQELTE